MHDDSFYYNVIRRNIKKIRKKKGLTQKQLATRAGITMNYLAKIESEKMQRSFTVLILGKIADALEVDISEFFKQD